MDRRKKVHSGLSPDLPTQNVKNGSIFNPHNLVVLAVCGQPCAGFGSQNHAASFQLCRGNAPIRPGDLTKRNSLLLLTIGS